MRTTQWVFGVCVTSAAAFGIPVAAADDDELTAPSGPIFQTPMQPKLVNPRITCTVEAVTGTHIMHRTCRTRAQVNAERMGAEQVASNLNRLIGRNYGTPGGFRQ